MTNLVEFWATRWSVNIAQMPQTSTKLLVCSAGRLRLRASECKLLPLSAIRLLLQRFILLLLLCSLLPLVCGLLLFVLLLAIVSHTPIGIQQPEQLKVAHEETHDPSLITKAKRYT